MRHRKFAILTLSTIVITVLIAVLVTASPSKENAVEVVLKQSGAVPPRTFKINTRSTPSRYTGNRTLSKLFYDWKWDDRDPQKNYAGFRPSDYHIYLAKAQQDAQGNTSYSKVRQIRDSDRNWNADKEQHVPFRVNKSGKIVGLYVSENGAWERAFSFDLVAAHNITHLFYAFYGICDYQRPNATENRSLDRLDGKVNSHRFQAMRASCGQGLAPSEDTRRSGDLVKLGVIDRQKNDFEISQYDYLAEPHAIDAIREMKKRYPHLKVMLSIGGWSLSDPFYPMVKNQAWRRSFIHSVIDTVSRSKGLWDGIDLDWEFPGGMGLSPNLTNGYAVDREGFVALVKELRQALDKTFGKSFNLTAAISAAPNKLAALNLEALKEDFTFINLMSYDLYGAWSKDPGHQTASRSKPLIAAYKKADFRKYATDELGKEVESNGITINQRELMAGLSTEGAIQMIQKLYPGFPLSKVAIGVATYSRGWEYLEVNKAHDKLFWHGQAQPWGQANQIAGLGVRGTFEHGVTDFREVWDQYVVPNNGEWLYYDEQADAAYIWQPHKEQNGANTTVATVHSFESPRSVIAKGKLVNQYKLAGLFAWEAQTDNGLLLNAINAAVCNPKADGSYYRFSQRYGGGINTKVIERDASGYASKVQETIAGSHHYRFDGTVFCNNRS